MYCLFFLLTLPGSFFSSLFSFECFAALSSSSGLSPTGKPILFVQLAQQPAIFYGPASGSQASFYRSPYRLVLLRVVPYKVTNVFPSLLLLLPPLLCYSSLLVAHAVFLPFSF